MKSVILKNIKHKAIVLAICAAVYLVLIMLSIFTPLGKLYVFGWTLDNLYCWNWLSVAVLILFNNLPTALAITAGNFAGVFLGEFLGGFIKEKTISQITPDMTAEYSAKIGTNYGVGIWAICVLCFTAAGIIYSIVTRKRRNFSPQSDNGGGKGERRGNPRG